MKEHFYYTTKKTMCQIEIKVEYFLKKIKKMLDFF